MTTFSKFCSHGIFCGNKVQRIIITLEWKIHKYIHSSKLFNGTDHISTKMKLVLRSTFTYYYQTIKSLLQKYSLRVVPINSSTQYFEKR